MAAAFFPLVLPFPPALSPGSEGEGVGHPQACNVSPGGTGVQGEVGDEGRPGNASSAGRAPLGSLFSPREFKYLRASVGGICQTPWAEILHLSKRDPSRKGFCLLAFQLGQRDKTRMKFLKPFGATRPAAFASTELSAEKFSLFL